MYYPIQHTHDRAGFNLLELMMASTLMTLMVTGMSLALRVSHTSWSEETADGMQMEAALGTLRHIVRQARQADSVAALTAGVDAGSLTILTEDGDSYTWDINTGTGQVTYGSLTAYLFAEGISALRFTGYAADGSETTTPGDIRSLRIEVSTTLPESGASRTVSSRVWMRSW